MAANCRRRRHFKHAFGRTFVVMLGNCWNCCSFSSNHASALSQHEHYNRNLTQCFIAVDIAFCIATRMLIWQVCQRCQRKKIYSQKEKEKKHRVCVKVCHAGLIIGLNYGTEILNFWAQSVPLSIELLVFKTQQLKAQQCMLSLHASVPFLLFLVCTTILKSFFRPLITAVCIALHLSAFQRKLWLFICLQVYSVFHF